ncbi:hypothetical protein AAG906_007995 [Vitis piasezkii]
MEWCFINPCRVLVVSVVLLSCNMFLISSPPAAAATSEAQVEAEAEALRNFTWWCQLKFSSFPSLLHLNLSHSSIYGRIPDEIGMLTKLTYLRISDCGLDGELPVSLGNLTLLEELDLSYNYDLSGAIPSSLGYLKNLIHLDLSHNFLSSSFGNLTNLKYLNLMSFLPLLEV